MAHTVLIATSPLNCRWITPGSRRSIERFDYAVCHRVHDAERVVNEVECACCPAWEPPRSGSWRLEADQPDAILGWE